MVNNSKAIEQKVKRLTKSVTTPTAGKCYNSTTAELKGLKSMIAIDKSFQ